MTPPEPRWIDRSGNLYDADGNLVEIARSRGYRIRRAIRWTLIPMGYVAAFLGATMEDKPMFRLSAMIFFLAFLACAIDGA